MKICFVPWSLLLKSEDIFNISQFRKLKEELAAHNIQLETIDNLPLEDADRALFFDAFVNGQFHLVKKAAECGILNKSIYMALEPPVVSKFNKPKRMLSWCNIFCTVVTPQKDLDHKKNIVYGYDVIDKATFDEGTEECLKTKKLLTSISGNKTSKERGELYSERKKAYLFFQSKIPDQFDFYGTGWDATEFPSYKGKVKTKKETLSNYKFALAYENTDRYNGYITEKPFDVLKAGAVPIYRGAKNILEIIPAKCIILAKDFKNYDTLLNYIATMSEEEYLSRLDAIKCFINSKEFYYFTEEYFAHFLSEILRGSESKREEAEGEMVWRRFCRKIRIKAFVKAFVKKLLRKKVIL